MIGGEALAPGDVVWADCPTFDPRFEGAPRRRPVVVVSSDEFMAVDDDVIVCPITRRQRALDVVFDWQGVGLRFPSVIRPKPTCTPRDAIVSRAGHLLPDDFRALQQALLRVLALTP